MSDPAEHIRERHRSYMKAHPERRCWNCAKDLNRHTVAEFQHCEFLLATSGQETMVMNRPDTEETGNCIHRIGMDGSCEECKTGEMERCGYCNKPITLSVSGTGYVHTETGLTTCIVAYPSDPLSPSATPEW